MKEKEYLDNIKMITINSMNEQKSLNMLNEDTTEADVDSGENFIGSIIGRYYQRALSPVFCDIQPMNGPTGVVFITSKSKAQKQINNITLGFVASSTKYSIELNDTEYSYTSASDGSDTDIDILTNLGNTLPATVSQSVDSTNKVLIITSLNDGEVFKITNPRNVKNTLTQKARVGGARIFLRKLATTELRDIKTRCTREYFNDVLSSYGKNANDIITKMISQDTVEEIDAIAVQKIKDISTKQSTLTLKSDSAFGAQYSYSDISSKIETIILGMAKETKRGVGAKILVSPKVAGALSSNSDIVRNTSKNESSRDYLGTLFGIYPIYVDTNSYLNSDTGVLVIHDGENFGDKPVIVAHYSTNLHFVDGYDLEESTVNVRDRRAIIQNPIDTEILGSTGVDDSKFCHYFEVDFSNISNVAEFL